LVAFKILLVKIFDKASSSLHGFGCPYKQKGATSMLLVSYAFKTLAGF